MPSTCTIPTCAAEHKAHGLCMRHYGQSNRRRIKAGATPAAWDWTAHVSEQTAHPSKQPSTPRQPRRTRNFTAAPDMSREGPPGGSPPDDAQGYAASSGGPVARSVAAVIARIPEDKREDPSPVLARALADLMDVAPAPSTARELRAVMKEVTAMAQVQEVSALGRIRDDLAARRAARESAASA
jgi:hypothetical protein